MHTMTDTAARTYCVESSHVLYTFYLVFINVHGECNSIHSPVCGVARSPFLLREERIFPRCIFPQLAIMDQLSGENSFKRVAIEIWNVRCGVCFLWTGRSRGAFRCNRDYSVNKKCVCETDWASFSDCIWILNMLPERSLTEWDRTWNAFSTISNCSRA